MKKWKDYSPGHRRDVVLFYIGLTVNLVVITILFWGTGCVSNKIVTYDQLPSYGKPRTEQTFSYEKVK